ncbi:choline/ethanolamine kinase-like [Ischnura elegans]|uniref:choline/ethanolamine kinase-like n=1 Tax=Ischnura elegans TaxID=197161 RepID=UPI001ED8851C|nr:choline/ethanolamine kinase-like [Ischnura elegans]
MIGPEPCFVQSIPHSIHEPPQPLPQQLLHTLSGSEGAEEVVRLAAGVEGNRGGLKAGDVDETREGGGVPVAGSPAADGLVAEIDGSEKGGDGGVCAFYCGELCEDVSAVNMSADPSDIRARAYQLCREYLHGAWRKISPEELIVRKVSGGLSNLLYYCALPESYSRAERERRSSGGRSCGIRSRSEPSAVLLRLYGQTTGGGSVGDKAIEGLITESVIFALLSESQRGPCLFGVFPGGRLEEYIPARPLRTRELADRRLSRLIAEKLAQIHLMKVPINKEPRWLWDTMERWLATIHEYSASGLIPDASKSAMQRFMGYGLRKELDWLREYLVSIRSPVVFCHNDLQEGNILLRTEEGAKGPGAPMKELGQHEPVEASGGVEGGGGEAGDGGGAGGGLSEEYREAEERWYHGLAASGAAAAALETESEEDECESGVEEEEDEAEVDHRQLVVIDFEYCSYNYRAFDFANHMCEWIYDYSNEKPPYFTARSKNFPTKKQQERFVTWYLEALRREAAAQGVQPPLRWGKGRRSDSEASGEDAEAQRDGAWDDASVDVDGGAFAEEVKALLSEIKAFTLASHFFWALWSIVNGTVSSIPFDYWEYGEARFRAYFRHKRRLLEEGTNSDQGSAHP